MSSFQYPRHLLHRVIEPQWFPDRRQETESNLTRLEAAEEAHVQYLQQILTEDASIAGAVMIGYRGPANLTTNNTAHTTNASTGNPSSTPHRRPRRSESSTASSTTSANNNNNATVDADQYLVGSAMSGGTGITTSRNSHVILPTSSSPGAASPMAQPPERFWNRPRREDSVIL